jgi:hypothetical protein
MGRFRPKLTHARADAGRFRSPRTETAQASPNGRGMGRSRPSPWSDAAPRLLHPEDLLERRRPLIWDPLGEQLGHRVLPARVDLLTREILACALEVV